MSGKLITTDKDGVDPSLVDYPLSFSNLYSQENGNKANRKCGKRGSQPEGVTELLFAGELSHVPRAAKVQPRAPSSSS